MRWPARTIAWWAGRAGFTGPDLVEAVRLALDGTGGNDNVTYGPAIGGLVEHVGLWLIPLARTAGEDAERSLLDPVTNAGEAFRLWEADGGWGWHPLGDTTHNPTTLTWATEAVKDPRPPEQRPLRPGLAVDPGQVDQAARELHEQTTNIAAASQAFRDLGR